MVGVPPQATRPGLDVAIEFLCGVQLLVRSEDHFRRRRREAPPVIGLPGLHYHRVTLRRTTDIQRAAHLEMLALVVGVVHLVGVEEPPRLLVAQEAEAREKYDRLTSLILEEDGIALIKGLTGGTLDLTGVDLDGPLPPVGPTEGMKSRQALIRQIEDENGFTIRQLYQHVASARGHFTVVGTATQIADTLEDWFHNEGADGFNILPPWLPTGLTDFVDLVIPELQRRGLFRTEYEGRTLRENLGLPFPETRWAAARRSAVAAE